MIVADGDLVIVHGRFSGFGAPVNWIAADILRIEDGVLVEHWDVIQDEATQEQSKSGRPMFGDSFPVYRYGRLPNEQLVTGDRRRKLSELQGRHPMVLVLSRGGY